MSRFLPMARRLALRYRRGGEPADDLVQVASMGLMKAVERFDPGRGVQFSSYAVPTIDGELKRYLRDTSWAAHVPQRMRERVRKVEQATERLRRMLGRSPTSDEVAEHIGLELVDVLEAAEAATASEALSLDAPCGEDGAVSRGETIGAAEPRYDMVEYGAALAPAIKALPAAPARDPVPAVPRGHDPVGDRSGHGDFPDARVAPAAPGPGSPAHGRAAASRCVESGPYDGPDGHPRPGPAVTLLPAPNRI